MNLSRRRWSHSSILTPTSSDFRIQAELSTSSLHFSIKFSCESCKTLKKKPCSKSPLTRSPLTFSGPSDTERNILRLNLSPLLSRHPFRPHLNPPKERISRETLKLLETSPNQLSLDNPNQGSTQKLEPSQTASKPKQPQTPNPKSITFLSKHD
jgi:hypothetical protein